MIPQVKILLDNGNQIDYKSSENLNIRLNRISDDLQDISKKYGEFSYSFSIPKTRNNDKVFEWPDVKGRSGIFKGKSFACKVFVDSHLLLQGTIELTGYNENDYSCVFFSNYTTFLDAIKGKKLVDLETLPSIEWDYEQTIIDSINGSAGVDDQDYQFIFSYYKPPFMSGATGQVETNSYDLKEEDLFGYYYNHMNTTLPWSKPLTNPFYWQSFPPAIYLKSIVSAIMQQAGWALSGEFFNDPSIKRIVTAFAGDPEAYQGAIISGATPSDTTLNLNKLLPDMNQVDFLRSTINMFNLYFSIDNENKQINFETYNTLFTNNDNAFDITNKIDKKTIKVSKPEVETKISFDNSKENKLVAGYGRLLDWDTYLYNHDTHRTVEPNPSNFLNVNNRIRENSLQKPRLKNTYNKNAFENLFNKTTGIKDIKLNFAPCNYFSYGIYNEESDTSENYSSAKYASPILTVGIPLASENTPWNSNDQKFADDITNNFCDGNSVENQVYGDGVKLLYYYGNNTAGYDFVITGSSGSDTYRNFSWIAMRTDGGSCSAPAISRLHIPLASPFQLLSNQQKGYLDKQLSGYTLADKQSELGAEAHYLLATYYSCAKLDNSHVTTSFSLTLGDNERFQFPNLYSYFHKRKYDELRNGSVVKATIHMDTYDWTQMQIQRPLLYDGEYYRLLEIRGFDPVKCQAEIQMLKKS